MEIIWWLPTQGDRRYIGEGKTRGTDHSYLQQVAQAIDFLGYDAMFLGSGSHCEDAWVSASAVASLTKHARFLLAQRPSSITPSVLARMAATFDRMFQGRVSFNIVSGISSHELEADGVFLNHDQRYEHTGEFLEIFNRLMSGQEVTYEGKYISVNAAKLQFPPVQEPHPPIYMSGTSEIALTIAAKYADVYLLFGETPEKAKEIVDIVSQKAKKYNREIRFGMCMYIIVREREEHAWEIANNMIKHVSTDQIEQFKKTLLNNESDCIKRRTSAIEESGSLHLTEHLWAGTQLLHLGPVAVVGDPDSVTSCLQEYIDIGVSTFVFSGVPNLEEAYQVAELVLPNFRG
ncbi:alkanesulfonate monooxygenase [Seinonella peptonophila]|uniref:Alkanesulfonate monooxygenase n=1 Tax=Seinonella peptonophila TaxID=112248 RepID=A0A1M4U9Q1_9BACL|nr:LLM class flavin-dependent oxidoreductase [Seinonella peptonophila]SHE53512.1 alkanesulfonate monooxygenase [Seinonella peptonophila]